MKANSAYDRRVFENIQKVLKVKGVKNQPSPSYLRVEKKLENAVSVYLFDIAKTSGEGVTERKLDRNDLFVITKPMFYLAKVDTTKQGKTLSQTFPSAQVFTAVAPGFDVLDLETIYNGFMSLKIGQVENIPAMAMTVFKIVPETQANTAGNLVSQFDALDMIPSIESLLFISGTMNVELKVQIPSFTGIAIQATDANVEHRLIFQPQGFLVRNGAQPFGN